MPIDLTCSTLQQFGATKSRLCSNTSCTLQLTCATHTPTNHHETRRRTTDSQRWRGRRSWRMFFSNSLGLQCWIRIIERWRSRPRITQGRRQSTRWQKVWAHFNIIRYYDFNDLCFSRMRGLPKRALAGGPAASSSPALAFSPLNPPPVRF